MTVSTELIFSLVIQLISVGIFIGVYKTTVSFMQQQILDLKTEMKRYNNVLERMIRLESSVSSAHKRIDDLEDDVKDLDDDIKDIEK